MNESHESVALTLPSRWQPAGSPDLLPAPQPAPSPLTPTHAAEQPPPEQPAQPVPPVQISRRPNAGGIRVTDPIGEHLRLV